MTQSRDYLLGARAGVNADLQEAARWFQELVDLGMADQIEHELAVRHLRDRSGDS